MMECCGLIDETLLAVSTIVKKEAFGVDGAEEVLVAVGQMRRAAESLQVFVVGIHVEEVDREVGAEQESAAELLPVGAFVDERFQMPVVPVPGAVCEIGIDAVVAVDVVEDLFFPIPLGEEKQGVLFTEMGKVNLQVVLPEDLVPALRGGVFLKRRFPDGLEAVVAAVDGDGDLLALAEPVEKVDLLHRVFPGIGFIGPGVEAQRGVELDPCKIMAPVCSLIDIAVESPHPGE